MAADRLPTPWNGNSEYELPGVVSVPRPIDRLRSLSGWLTAGKFLGNGIRKLFLACEIVNA